MYIIVQTVGMGVTGLPVTARDNALMDTSVLNVTKSVLNVWIVIKIQDIAFPVIIAIMDKAANSSATKTVWLDAKYPGNVISVMKDSTAKRVMLHAHLQTVAMGVSDLQEIVQGGDVTPGFGGHCVRKNVQRTVGLHHVTKWTEHARHVRTDTAVGPVVKNVTTSTAVCVSLMSQHASIVTMGGGGNTVIKGARTTAATLTALNTPESVANAILGFTDLTARERVNRCVKRVQIMQLVIHAKPGIMGLIVLKGAPIGARVAHVMENV